jgi:hypothetical protein
MENSDVSCVGISSDVNGEHQESNFGRIDPADHLRMLGAAIEQADPSRHRDVIVTAIAKPYQDCSTILRQHRFDEE